MKDIKIVDLTPENIPDYGLCGYKNVKKHVELQRKIDWFKKYQSKGLTIKAAIAADGSYQGMIEYVPGEFAHRPVKADEFMFIHCIFVGFKKEYKGRGLGSMMIEECIKDAKKEKLKGVAVVTRKGSFMAKKDIFEQMGLEIVDKAEPDFQLMMMKFDDDAEDPKFNDLEKNLKKYEDDELVLLRSVQCPYTEKNVNSIMDTAKEKFDIDVKLVDLKDHKKIQNSPCAFGVFCLIHNGEIISYHPISNTRFENIMNKRLGE
jgi:N-acetylglutamate synthase-like GNAT family acetyltransferase